MARHAIHRVIDNHLLPPESADASFPPIRVGSEAWYAWLSQPATCSFAFSSPQGTLTARREHRHGTWYWYAYRSQDGHLHKAYLGKSQELTPLRLQEVATSLSAGRATSQQPSDTLQPSAATSPPSSVTSMPPPHPLPTK